MKIIQNRRVQLALAVVLIVFINLYDLTSQYAITIINDEFGYVGIAAQMAGYDFTDTLSTSYYYSYGLSLILALLFKIGLTGAAFFRAVIVLNVLFLVGSFLLTYYFAKELFGTKWDVLIALVVNLYSSNILQSKLSWTETLLYFLTWVLLFYVYRLNRKYELKYLAGAMVVAVYMYMVHQRALAAMIAAVFMMFYIWATKHKSRKEFFKFALVLAIMAGIMLLTGEAKDYIISNWYVAENAQVKRIATNDYGAQAGKLSKLKDVKYLACLVFSMVGKLWAQSVASGLLILYSLAAAVFLVWKKVLAKVKEKASLKLEDAQVFLVMSSLLFCGSVGIAAIYYLRTLSMQKYYDIVMTRYIDYTAGPMLLFGLYILYHYRTYIREMVLSGIAVLGMTGLTYFQFKKSHQPLMIMINMPSVYPFIKKVTESLSAIIIAGIGVVVFALFVALVLHLAKGKGRQEGAFLAVTVLLGGIFVFNGIEMAEGYTGHKQQEVIEYVLPVVDYLEDVQFDGTLYYLDTEYNDQFNFLKILQFMKPDLKLEIIPKEEIETVWNQEKGNLLMYPAGAAEEFDMSGFSDAFLMDTGRLCVYGTK